MSAGGMFGPGSVTWHVYGETAMVLGGGRALVLQMAHPHVGAAVEQHSRYRVDRWGRLRHTLRTVGEILFGETEAAARSAERMRRMHARYRGVVPAGRAAGAAYDATDPSVVLWVWATLVDTSLLVHELFVGSLTEPEQARFYDEQRRFAELCGVPEAAVPPTLAAFRTYVALMVAETLEATPAAREAAALVTNPFGVPRALAPLAELTALPTAGLLPEPLRRELGVAWSPARALALALLAAVFRRLRPWLPARLRRVRSARAAEERVAAERGKAGEERGDDHEPESAVGVPAQRAPEA